MHTHQSQDKSMNACSHDFIVFCLRAHALENGVSKAVCRNIPGQLPHTFPSRTGRFPPNAAPQQPRAVDEAELHCCPLLHLVLALQEPLLQANPVPQQWVARQSVSVAAGAAGALKGGCLSQVVLPLVWVRALASQPRCCGMNPVLVLV